MDNPAQPANTMICHFVSQRRAAKHSRARPAERKNAMKKLVLLTGIVLIACVCMEHFAAPPSPAAYPSAAASPSPEAADAGYIIRDSNGKIAVFAAGNDHPLFTTETRTESLPRADAKRLREGVRAPDRQALRRILEDYCS